jgi:hypothetical protein
MPGPEMIAALAQVSLQGCTDEQLLDVLAGWQRVEAWVAAQQARALARTRQRLLETTVREETDLEGNTPWETVYRQVETEISTKLRWTSRFALHHLDIADQLTSRLPGVLDALEAGQLTYRHAEMICEETITLTEAQARQAVEKVLPEASTKTVGGLRRRLRKACLQIDPDTANDRAARAAKERTVTIRPLPDGLAQLTAIGPAEAILAMFRILDETADRAGTTDPRTRTARRFDALVDFVLASAQINDHCPCPSHRHPEHSHPASPAAGHGHPRGGGGAGANAAHGHPASPDAEHGWPYAAGSPGGPPRPDCPGWQGRSQAEHGCPPPSKIPALVQITMDLATLLGLRNNPAELHGYGPLPANLARALAADADWQRFIQDPITGAPHDLGRARRHPTAGLRRWIIARDQTCLFPECYRPAGHCEPDHNPAWQHHGRTDKDTLTQLCPKHHKVRHHGWSYSRHPDRIIWTSPHQQTYERHLTEADLLPPTDASPHPDHDHDHNHNHDHDHDVDHDFDDTIWPPTDEDQRLETWLPNTHPRRIEEFTRPPEEIPSDIVQAFRLDDPDSPWSREPHPYLDDYDPTPEEQQAILDAEDHRYWGSNPQQIDPDTLTGQTRIEKARRKQQPQQSFADDPPF